MSKLVILSIVGLPLFGFLTGWVKGLFGFIFLLALPIGVFFYLELRHFWREVNLIRSLKANHAQTRQTDNNQINSYQN